MDRKKERRNVFKLYAINMRLYVKRIEINVFEIFFQPGKSVVENTNGKKKKSAMAHTIRDGKLLSITIKASIK